MSYLTTFYQNNVITLDFNVFIFSIVYSQRFSEMNRSILLNFFSTADILILWIFRKIP